ncbi:hypothetical protein BDZ94DRAFT_1251478 [Collybia nuda]|uniref:Uncharacterized protein n=1 Tax=Collybia nuda TaxID=64659 RepID=A0A9P6CLE2_9AGAR|nr:hypothetical protein BDZ94DRAFT_1251478 [Collybia nuda]
MDKKWKSKTTSVEIVQVPKRGTGITAKRSTEFTCLNQLDPCNDAKYFQLDQVKPYVQVTGPIRRIRTSIPWRDVSHPATCNHPQSMTSNVQTGMKQHSPITKVRVVAKLSTGSSEQLLDEARKYQGFASHLPNHSTGFNPIPSPQDLAPGGVIIPRFYGYYVPGSSTKQESDHEVDRDHSFQGPILLLKDRESVGDLDVDDKLASPSLLRQRAFIHQ